MFNQRHRDCTLPFSSSLDKGTLYRLHSLIDQRSVVNDPKKELHASQSLLSVVLEAQILKPMTLYIFQKQIPTSAKKWMDCLEQLATKVVGYIVLDPTNNLTTPMTQMM